MTPITEVAPANLVDELAEIRERAQRWPSAKMAGHTMPTYDACRDRETLLALYDDACAGLHQAGIDGESRFHKYQQMLAECDRLVEEAKKLPVDPVMRLLAQVYEDLEHLRSTLECEAPLYACPGTLGFVEGRLTGVCQVIGNCLGRPSPSTPIDEPTEPATSY